MARGTDANFDQITAMLLDNARKFETGVIKWIKYSDVLDSAFSGQFGWSKTEFYAELNRRLGISNNDQRRADKEARIATRTKTVKAPKKSRKKIDDDEF